MFPSLVAGGLTLLMASVDPVSAERFVEAQEPPATAASAIQVPADAFPSATMAEQFEAYLAWTKAEGLSRLVAFESLPADEIHHSPDLSGQMRLPSAEMAEQFDAYLRWTQEEGLGRFHAFQVSQFD
jgi:hypothetical protein